MYIYRREIIFYRAVAIERGMIIMHTEEEDERGRERTFDNSNMIANNQKLNMGLRKVFEGVIMIFDSLGTHPDIAEVFNLSKSPTSLTSRGVTNYVSCVSCTEKSKGHAQEQLDMESIPKNAPENASPESRTLVKPDSPSEADKLPKVLDTTEVNTEQSHVSPKEAKSSITADDIVKVVVKKLKQNRENDEKIGMIVHEYGVSAISQLPASKYEAFLAEIASL